jgi:serine/threonine protein kinase
MKYTKIKKIGDGSFGTVYLIKDKKYDDNYALKCFNKENYESFSNEISFLMKLNHPNIVNIINYYESPKYYNIVLPYAKLGTLNNLIRRRKNNKKKFEYEDIKYIITAISRGINYLHQNKIIHCDIKPSNILLFGNKIIKICDFGVSKHFKTNEHNTFVGTPYYIAPEVVNEEGYNNSIDYWSLGIILYELITFKKPFYGSHYYQLMIQIIRNNYNINIVPEKYKNLVLNLLNQDFKKRYKHIDIMRYFENTIHLPLIIKRLI